MSQFFSHKKIILLVLIFISSTLCYSQTQGQMNEDANAKYVQADKNLNTVYKEILKSYKADTAFIKNLKTSQALWIKFRDAELKMKYPEGGSYGSVKPMCMSMYLESLTLDRTKTLQIWLDGIEEGDVCMGSVKIKHQSDSKKKSEIISCSILNEEIYNKLSELSKKMSKPSSSEDLIDDFKKLKTLQLAVNKEIRTINVDSISSQTDTCLKKIEQLIPFFKRVYSEEGTVIFFTLNNKNLLKAAASTKEKTDDNFFSFLKEVYGDYGEYMITFPVWMTKVTHISGYSNLGDGIHTKILKELFVLKTEKNSFVKESLDAIYDLLIDDLISPHSFGNTKEVALKELRSLITDKSIGISEADMKKLVEAEKKIETGKFQFECKTKKCNFE
jgi:uncharacterized protein YecT (DUF1311 family)